MYVKQRNRQNMSAFRLFTHIFIIFVSQSTIQTNSKAYQKELNDKKLIFKEVANPRKAVHLVLVTTDGLQHNAYTNDVQNEVCLDDLFL